MLIAVPAALVAGWCFALAGVLQQRAASREPEEENLSVRLLRRLAHRPLWLAGIALAVLAYAFQSLALAFGPLSLVQPLIVTEMVFAIPLSVWLHRVRLGAREWLGVAAVTGGLVTALAAARPRGGQPSAPLAQWLPALALLGAVTVSALLVARWTRGPARASLTALAGGVVMGSQSVFLAVTIENFRQGLFAVVASWQTYLLVAASAGGLLLIQSAFQSGPLAASMPVFDASEPAVAVLMGVALFGESVGDGAAAGALTVLGALVLLAGIVLLDTSPLLEAVHRQAEQERPDGRADGQPDGRPGERPAEAGVRRLSPRRAFRRGRCAAGPGACP